LVFILKIIKSGNPFLPLYPCKFDQNLSKKLVSRLAGLRTSKTQWKLMGEIKIFESPASLVES
jgi:hypothetical protein